METPLELLTYLFIFSSCFSAVKYFFVSQQKNKTLIYRKSLYSKKFNIVCSVNADTVNPIRNFFSLRQRKIPICENTYTADEEGRLPLVFS